MITILIDGEKLDECETDEESYVDDVSEVSWIQSWSGKHVWKCQPDTSRCWCVVVSHLVSAALVR